MHISLVEHYLEQNQKKRRESKPYHMSFSPLIFLDGTNANGSLVPKNVIWEMLVVGLISAGVPLSILSRRELTTVLSIILEAPPSQESLYNQIAFPIEQKILSNVCK